MKLGSKIFSTTIKPLIFRFSTNFLWFKSHHSNSLFLDQNPLLSPLPQPPSSSLSLSPATVQKDGQFCFPVGARILSASVCILWP